MASNPDLSPAATSPPAVGPGFGARAAPREFRALITPHRSMRKSHLRVLMALLLVVAVFATGPFLIMGAWPVTGFLGLDLLGLYIAFRLSFARARAFEEVVVTNGALTVRKVSHRGETSEQRLNPLWTRLHRDDDDEFGLMGLRLVSRGESIPVAAELSPPERAAFADALKDALLAARRGELPG